MLAMLSGYWYSQGLFVLAELNIADHLANGPASSTALAKCCGADASALFRFLRAMADAGLVIQLDADLFGATPLLDLLRDSHPASLRSLARLGGHPLHWQAWGQLLDNVQTGRCAFETAHNMPFYNALAQDPKAAALFAKVMQASDSIDKEILAVLEVPDRGQIADIGGSNGGLISKIIAKHPQLRGIVFDISIEDHQGRQNPSGGRVNHIQGDFLDTVPPGCEGYILKFVLHNWDDRRAERILKNCSKAMNPNSRLFVVEGLLPEGSVSSYASRHDLNMMVLTNSKERSQADYQTLGASAGLSPKGRIDMVSGATILIFAPASAL